MEENTNDLSSPPCNKIPIHTQTSSAEIEKRSAVARAKSQTEVQRAPVQMVVPRTTEFFFKKKI